MKKIKLKMGMASLLLTAVVIACVIFVNAIISVIVDKHPLKVDLTKDKVYEFSQQTKDVMKGLDATVTAYALMPEGTQGEYIDYIKEYLDRYKVLSKNFKVKYIDPYEDPAFMQKYNDGENQASAGSVIIECGDAFKVITFDQIYSQSSYDGSIQTDMERKVTNAVMTVTGKLSGAKAYFMTGHSEYALEQLKTHLADEGYICDDVNIMKDGVPKDAGLLVCVAPTEDLTEEERNGIDKFMDKGGQFLFVAAPGMKPMERFDAYLEEWGLKLDYDYVMETDKEHAAMLGNTVVPIPSLNEHSINEKIKDSKSLLIMPESMSVSKVKSANSAFVTELLVTSDKAYGISTENQDAKKISGPMSLASISEKQGDKNSALMVIGSLSMMGALSEGAYLNGDFVLNAVNYMCSKSVDTGMRAKQISAELMQMTEGQVAAWAILLQYIMPVIIIIIGLVVWLKRRYK